MSVAETDPNGLSPHAPGAKLDAGKPPVMRGAIQYFPRALRAVAAVSAVGAEKYAWEGWREVPDAVNRYGDAMARHMVEDAIHPFDESTGHLHKAHVAWNALAVLEKTLEEAEQCGYANPNTLN